MRLLWLSVILFSGVSAYPHEDEVHNLPGYGRPPTKQYSGFLNAKDGCAPGEDVCQIHYWFAAAEGDAAKKPVVLWLNGGPGATSIIGMLAEMGPLMMNSFGKLVDNPYAWTKIANFFIIEAPVGVGYSFCSSQIKGGRCNNTDKLTASASRAALIDFFNYKFPELKSNEFFITGESYAGVYIPTLTKELLDNAKGIVNLKGIAVGDPCTDTPAQLDSMDGLWYGHKYGLVPDQQFDFLWNTCGARRPSIHDIHKNGFDVDVGLPGAGETFKKGDPKCVAEYRKFLLSFGKSFSETGWDRQWINAYSLFSPSGLKGQNSALNKWMMRRDVRKALHVEQSPAKQWPTPAKGFRYTSQYNACANRPNEKSMIDFYREIAPQLKTTVVYNGDTDPCVTYEGTRTAITRLGFAEIDGGGYRPWFFKQTAALLPFLAVKPALFGPDLNPVAAGTQFGGEVVNYEHNLDFVTFHGSGHMVPEFRPIAALHFLRKVLGYKILSPLMPKNYTMLTYTDAQFDKVLDSWTDLAKSAPYSG